MIQYDAKNWLTIVLRLSGSVLPRLLPRIIAAAGVGGVAAWAFVQHGTKIPTIVHTLIGVALGLLLVFRTNASYDRYWEGRRLLGGMVNRSRDLARQSASFIAERKVRVDIVRMVRAFFWLSMQGLRQERDLSALGDALTDDERRALEPVSARAPVMATWLSERITAESDAGRLSDARLQMMDANVQVLIDNLGGAERIVKTPIPFAYAQHIKTFVVLFCFSAPFAMSEMMRWYTPVAAAILAFALFGIDEIGVEIEDPFGYDPNDLAIEQIGEGIVKVTEEIISVRRP